VVILALGTILYVFAARAYKERPITHTDQVRGGLGCGRGGGLRV
jgi:hypothetical protein